jgi:hypothetical protein
MRCFSVAPVQAFHHQEGAAVLLADIVDGADAGVVQRRGRSCLAAESGEGFGIGGEVWRQELQGDGALQPGILGFVDDAHPAAAELLDDAVMRDRLTDQRIAAGPTAVVAALIGELACGEIERQSTEEPVGTVVCSEQRTDFFLQPLVAAARVAKIGVALDRGHLERGLQQLIDVIPAISVHWRSGRRALDTTRLSRSSTRASR